MTPHPTNGQTPSDEDNLIEAATALTKGDIIPSRPLRVKLGKRLLELEAALEKVKTENDSLKDTLHDYAESCAMSSHEPHCYCLPAIETLASLLPARK